MEKRNKTRKQLIIEEALTNQDSDKTWSDLGKVLVEEFIQRLKGKGTTAMRLGKVYIPTHYVVDLDDDTMVAEAENCMYEDIMNAVKYNEMSNWIQITEDSSLSESDIPDFLTEFLRDSDEIENEHIDVIASGYEWECPHCETLNKEIEILEVMKCSNCHRNFTVDEFHHAYGNH